PSQQAIATFPNSWIAAANLVAARPRQTSRESGEQGCQQAPADRAPTELLLAAGWIYPEAVRPRELAPVARRQPGIPISRATRQCLASIAARAKAAVRDESGFGSIFGPRST